MTRQQSTVIRKLLGRGEMRDFGNLQAYLITSLHNERSLIRPKWAGSVEGTEKRMNHRKHVPPVQNPPKGPFLLPPRRKRHSFPVTD